jgi:hypothetical protein
VTAHAVRALPLATANASKVALLQSLAGTAWRVEGYDPFDAEERAEPGYRSAAEAKAAAVGLRYGPALALGHDSGFEFECLDGAPGPLTRRWLKGGRPADRITALSPGSAVRVVHCLALWTPEGTRTVLHSDRRVVAADPAALLCSNELPLSDIAIGERGALARCVDEILSLAAAVADGILEGAA